MRLEELKYNIERIREIFDDIIDNRMQNSSDKDKLHEDYGKLDFRITMLEEEVKALEEKCTILNMKQG